MGDHTASTTVYPSGNDLFKSGGASGDGKGLREERQAEFARSWIENRVLSGLSVPASSVDLTIQVALGKAILYGHWLDIEATTVTAAASATNHLFLKITLDGNDRISLVEYEVNTTGTAPANSLKIAQLTTDADNITATSDKRTFGRVGTMQPFGGDEDRLPDGALLCDGSAVSEATYVALFSCIAYSYGNPGGGNFNVPDKRGRLSMGKDNMGGSSANRAKEAAADSVGGTGGDEDAVAAHTHPIPHTHGGTGSDHGINNTNSGSEGDLNTNSVGDAIGGNWPPYEVDNWLIWYK